jgi:hypothetical protein
VLIYPVADDGSTLGQLYARTGTEGMYEVHVEPGRYMVAFGDARVPTEVSPRGHTLVDYAAPVSGEVTVRVPHDGGIANVLVSLVVISSRGAVHEMLSRTGPGGTARFAEVPEGKGEVTASVPKREGGTPIYATTKFDAPGEGSVEVELHMPSGALTLFVADTAGRPLAGVAVEVWSRLHRGSPDVRTTGAEGRVSFTNLVAGRTTVRASLPGYAPRIAEFRAEEGGMRHHLVLAHGRQVPVRVTLTTGEPMQIVLRALAIRDAQPGRMWESRTGEDGSGVLEDLPAESILLRFVAAGCKEVLMELPANTPSAEVRFERVAK